MADLETGDFENLEDMIDRHTLADVLYAISEICYDKAEHISSDWQDEKTANVWNRAARKIEDFQGNLDI